MMNLSDTQLSGDLNNAGTIGPEIDIRTQKMPNGGI